MTPDSVCTFNSPLTAPTAGAAKFSSSKGRAPGPDRKSTRLNSSHLVISYAVFCLKKKKKKKKEDCKKKNIKTIQKNTKKLIEVHRCGSNSFMMHVHCLSVYDAMMRHGASHCAAH